MKRRLTLLFRLFLLLNVLTSFNPVVAQDKHIRHLREKAFSRFQADPLCQEDLGLLARITSDLVWSPDSTQIAIATFDVDWEQCIRNPIVQVLDAASGQTIFRYENDVSVFALTWLPDNRGLIIGDDRGTIRQFDIKTGQITATYSVSSLPIVSISWNPSSQRLASGGWDNLIRVTSSSGEVLQSLDFGASDFPGYRSGVIWVGWSPDGTKLASTHTDGTAYIRDAATLQPLVDLHQSIASPLTGEWSPNGTKLAIGSAEGNLNIWDVQTSTLLLTIAAYPQRAPALISSPDDSFIASGMFEGTIRIWNAISGELINEITPPNGQPLSQFAWSGQGQFAYATELFFQHDQNGNEIDPGYSINFISPLPN